MENDPFRYLPELRGRLKPAAESDLRVDARVMALWDQRARDQGRGPDWRLSDHALEAGRRALLGPCTPPRELWVFGYGSLMWDPSVHFSEVRRARLAGHQRRFAFTTTLGRGSIERPGLMLSLDAGDGDCEGLVFRLAPECADAESSLLWRREMLRGSYCPRLLAVHTPQGGLTALVFACNRDHPSYVGDMALHEAAQVIAEGHGVLGSNRDYLEQMAAQLQTLGVHDAYVSALLREVRLRC